MSVVELAADGRLDELPEDVRRRFVARELPQDADLVESVRGIVADVRRRGDEALLEQASAFDGVTLQRLEIPSERWTEALTSLPATVRAALERAVRNIETFHRAQLPEDVTVQVEPGVEVCRRWAPLARVGVYVPGGRAAYPSSVLMGVVPARAAGVGDIIVCSPPGPSGEPSPEVMAACALSGATRLFAAGGAGAVAAMAYGTASVPAVDTIVGPGNKWVTEAKKQVAGHVPVDSPAGPSEVLVVADDSADAEAVARELLAQAEHDPDATAVLVSPNEALIDQVRRLLSDWVPDEPRRDIIESALRSGGGLILTANIDQALEFAEAYGAEHLCVMTHSAQEHARRITTAGTIFVGEASSVAFGDYMTGANHVLPTSGRAKSFSGLSAMNYLRSFTVQTLTRDGAARMADDVIALADAEGLPAHAAAARQRSRT